MDTEVVAVWGAVVFALTWLDGADVLAAMIMWFFAVCAVSLFALATSRRKRKASV